MGNLLRNEYMKLFRHWSSWVMIGLLLVSVGVVGVVFNQAGKQVSNDWKGQLASQILDGEKTLHDPNTKLTEQMKIGIQEDIAKNRYAIENNIAPNEITGMSFTRYATALSTVVMIFAIVVAGVSVSSEFTWGTIRMMAVRPVKRSKLLLAKYLATVGWGMLLLVLLFICSSLLGGILFGFSGADHAYLYMSADGVHQMSMFTVTLLTYIVQVITLLLFITVAFLISTVFRRLVLAVPIALLVCFAGNAVYPRLTGYAWGKYFLFTNLDLLQYYEGTPAIPDMTMGFSLAVLAVYFVVLIVGAWLLFVKRDLIKERVNF